MDERARRERVDDIAKGVMLGLWYFVLSWLLVVAMAGGFALLVWQLAFRAA